LKFNHNFDWNNVKILDFESNYQKRLISEMIHIKSQKNGINLNEDTDYWMKRISIYLTEFLTTNFKHTVFGIIP